MRGEDASTGVTVTVETVESNECSQRAAVVMRANDYDNSDASCEDAGGASCGALCCRGVSCIGGCHMALALCAEKEDSERARSTSQDRVN